MQQRDSDDVDPVHDAKLGVPPCITVLIVEMTGGSMLLQGWRNGPSAYVSADDAAPLRRALAAAYGSECVDEALS